MAQELLDQPDIDAIVDQCISGTDGRVSARTLPLGRGDDLVCSRARHGQSGDISGSQVEIAKLQSWKDKLLEAKDTYWANQVEVERLIEVADVFRRFAADYVSAHGASMLPSQTTLHPMPC